MDGKMDSRFYSKYIEQSILMWCLGKHIKSSVFKKVRHQTLK